MSKITNAMLMEALNGINAKFDTLNARVTALEENRKSKPTNAYKGKVKDVPFTKHDGTVVMTTQAQADAWAKRRDNFVDKETALKDWETKKAEYKPSQAFIDAIKADRSKITFEIAKKQYGFVGTKNSLKDLKDSICK